MKPIYVTYTSVLLNGNKFRFAVECKTEKQAREAGYHLKSRPNVENIRINRTGRNLPPEAAVFPFHEYMNA
jgi:hypothetical protein